MNAMHIAPCGMNCNLCMAYQRENNQCKGCLSGELTAKSCIQCIMRNCKLLAQTKSNFCYDCPKYPCARLKNLDKRYRTKYQMSMLENLEHIKVNGLDAFIQSEKKRWSCPDCGELICVHRSKCFNCNWSFN